MNRSAVGTLVERFTRFVLLLHLANNHGAETVEAAMRQAVMTLPELLCKSITRDQGSEMSGHARFTMATGRAETTIRSRVSASFFSRTPGLSVTFCSVSRSVDLSGKEAIFIVSEWGLQPCSVGCALFHLIVHKVKPPLCGLSKG